MITIEFLKSKKAKIPDKPIPVYLKILQSERLEDSRKRTTKRLIPGQCKNQVVKMWANMVNFAA